jgi:hypothetical protein
MKKKPSSTDDRHKGKPKILRFTEEELAACRDAASAEKLVSVAAWMKRAILLEAERVLGAKK